MPFASFMSLCCNCPLSGLIVKQVFFCFLKYSFHVLDINVEISHAFVYAGCEATNMIVLYL